MQLEKMEPDSAGSIEFLFVHTVMLYAHVIVLEFGFDVNCWMDSLQVWNKVY